MFCREAQVLKYEFSIAGKGEQLTNHGYEYIVKYIILRKLSGELFLK